LSKIVIMDMADRMHDIGKLSHIILSVAVLFFKDIQLKYGII
jgi:hypothetical protein